MMDLHLNGAVERWSTTKRGFLEDTARRKAFHRDLLSTIKYLGSDFNEQK
jgi:hypothetical protein